MIFKRALMAIVAITAIATAAAISLVAAALAGYALLRPDLGPAGAAAVVAAVFALIVGFAGLIVALGGRRGKVRRGEQDPVRLAEQLVDMVRDKPLAAAGVALAAGLMIIRSPQAISGVVRAFFDSWMAGRPERR